MQVFYTARAELSRLTADYDAGPDERSLNAVLTARVAYDDATTALEVHEMLHRCA